MSGARAGVNAARFSDEHGWNGLDRDEIARLKGVLWGPKERKGGFTPQWALQVLQDVVTPYWVLLYKREDRLQAALNYIGFMRDHIVPQLMAYDNHDLRLVHEVRNIVLHMEMKLRASLFRKESRWYHYREDYPLRDDENWLCWVKIQDVNAQYAAKLVSVDEALSHIHDGDVIGSGAAANEPARLLGRLHSLNGRVHGLKFISGLGMRDYPFLSDPVCLGELYHGLHLHDGGRESSPPQGTDQCVPCQPAQRNFPLDGPQSAECFYGRCHAHGQARLFPDVYVPDPRA